MSLRCSRHLACALFGLALATLSGVIPACAEAASNPIAVNVDQARLVKLPSQVATIVVGNPLIADVTLQAGNIVVVTGKGYGATNFIAMDRAGAVLLDRQIEVDGPPGELVTVYRGVERETYTCKPVCQRRMTLGDGDAYFNTTSGQSKALNSDATAIATASAAAGKAPLREDRGAATGEKKD